jgi:small multidrug resistance family-3 protein
MLTELQALKDKLPPDDHMEAIIATKSILFSILAGLFEIGGGYLVWLWLREGKSVWYGLMGAIVLIFYGIIPTMQPANFGRVYAA